ncbi:MAG: 2-hydroxyacid dehydrogenase [Victivallaceae bacterium]|nr:2-hydroxyacid dehydrogenase [Victivallaceae bacterium]
MKKFKIAFFDTKPYDRLTFEPAVENTPFEILFLEARLTRHSVKMAEECHAVCIFVNDELSAPILEKLAQFGIRLVLLRCAGFNNVDLEAAKRLGITALRVPAYSPRAVAEYTLGMLLCLDRKIHRAFCRVRENNFSINGFLGFDLYGKTIGIVGTGKIGITFAKLLQGFGMRLLAYDPYPAKDAAELGLEYVSCDELYHACDILSFHCPLSAENVHMVNKDSIGKMKRGVIILNTSRGKLIDTAALVEGLKAKKIGGAGLDVYEEETDYFFEDRSDSAIDDDVLARLLTFPNVLVTSHQAFFTREAVDAIAATTIGNASAFFDGKPLVNKVC